MYPINSKKTRGGAKAGQESIGLKFFRGLISGLGLCLFAFSLFNVARAEISSDWLLLALITILIVSRIETSILKTSRAMTFSDTFLFTSVLLYGPYPSVLLAGIDAVISGLQQRKHKVLLFSMAQKSASIFASSSLIYILIDFQGRSMDAGRLALAAAILGLVHYIINSWISTMALALEQRRGLMSIWHESSLWTSVLYFTGAAVAFLMVKLIAVVSFYAFIVSVPILTISFYAYRVYLDKVEASNHHAEEMAELHLRTIEALAIAIDAKDEVTHDHVRRVQIYSTGLARLFGLSDGEIEALKAGALLHDIGKLAVPDYILNKPGQLTPAEFEKMKVHTIVGAEILERVGFPYPVAPVVRHHHERWDGRGYPDGLRGDQIPITARILTVADCFDAVREDRQYRKAMTQEEAISFLREASTTVFDPTVVSVFLDHLEDFESEIRAQGVDRTFAEPQMEKGILKPPVLNTGPKVYEHIRSAHREVVALYGIAETIGTSLDLRDTFAVFSSRLLDIVSYTTCVLYLQRHDTAEVEAAHVSGRNMERFKGRKMPSGAGLTGWVIANRHPMHNCDPRLDLDALKMDATEQYKVATVVPLIKDGSAVGALALYSTDLTSYEADHLRLIEAVAKLASDAIANAVHHERTETNALTDLLTGLPNARALRYKFEEAADRAQRHKDSFSVVMMDLDGFKAVNDHLGHQAGDHMLREVARVLLTQLRSSDFITRYAGDEFVAVLNIGPEEVHELIRRIQRAVEKHEFLVDGNALYIGLSVGWASFSRDGETLDELLLAADRSMYSDKAKRKTISPENPDFRTSDLSRYSIM